MGRDKLSLEVGGLPMPRRASDALGGFCSEIIVVGEGGAEVELPNTRRIPDLRGEKQGPLAGLEAGLSASKNERVFVVAGDMPFVSVALADQLRRKLAESDGIHAAVPVLNGRLNPLCAAYSRGILESVSAALDGGTRSVVEYLDSLGGALYVESELERFGDPEIFLMNVNSTGDLARARSLA